MIVFLDTNIVIYPVENPPLFGVGAVAAVTNLRTAGHTFAVSDLVRLECRTLPLRRSNGAMLADYDAFFARRRFRRLRGQVEIAAAKCLQ